MRFVLAIVALFIAACMVGYGVAQRTILLASSTVSLTAQSVDNPQPYTVVTDAALHAYPGAQTFTINGSEHIYMAYGRDTDVRGWLGNATYTVVDFDTAKDELTSRVIQGTPEPPNVPTPANQPASPQGSDLWLGEYAGQEALMAVINVPQGISALISSDGVQAAPPVVTVSWPLDNSTPFVGPLIVGGFALLIVGLILLMWGVIYMRRSRGPRRKALTHSGDDTRQLTASGRRRWIPSGIRASDKRRRGGSMIAAIPLMLTVAVVMSGCSPNYWPGSSVATTTPTPTKTSARGIPDAEDVTPAVTVPQTGKIVGNIATTVGAADETRDSAEAALRLSGPALDVREADYKIRGVVADYVGGAPIPNNVPVLTLPQATVGWPRTVMTVVENPAGSEVPPTVLMMTQALPRENYTVPYALSLFETIPEVAPASIGAPVVAPDSKLLRIAPDRVAAAYGDVLTYGGSSQFFDLFHEEGDDFRTAYGSDAKNRRKASIPQTASLEFSNAPGGGPVLALATSDSGALVAVELAESEVIKPVQKGATVVQNGAASKALSGLEASTKGIQTIYGGQLLFYIPPAGSASKITLLGYNQALISSSELQ